MQVTNDIEMTLYRAGTVQGCLWKISLLRYKCTKGASPMQSSKKSACNAKAPGDTTLIPGVGKIPWRKSWKLTRVFLPRESHGQRSLAGYSL